MANTVDAKLLRQTKFPPEFSRKVDMTKVNIEVMKKWIAGKISQILGNEDDVVIELCFNLLEGARFPDIKSLQIQLTGFLDRDTPRFCKDLWNLCLSAQESPQGVPKELLEAKKLELMQEKKDAEKASEGARQRAERDRQRERDIEVVRRQEREDRVHTTSRNDRTRRYHAGADQHAPKQSQHRARRRSRSPPDRGRDVEYPNDRDRNGRDDGGSRRNTSRSPYRRSRNEYRHSHTRRRSYSTDSDSYATKSRREKKSRGYSRSATPPKSHKKDEPRESSPRSVSPARQHNE